MVALREEFYRQQTPKCSFNQLWTEKKNELSPQAQPTIQSLAQDVSFGLTRLSSSPETEIAEGKVGRCKEFHVVKDFHQNEGADPSFNRELQKWCSSKS